MNNEINNSRAKIDNIDDELVKLFAERMNIVADIAKSKCDSGVPVRDNAREESILKRVCGSVGQDIKVYTKQLFEQIFENSRAYQNNFALPKSQMAMSILDAIKEDYKIPCDANVCCQGIEGAYSSLACKRIFELPNISYVKSFENVFDAVNKGLCEYGILPIENSTAGSVDAVYDLMKKYNCYIVKSIKLPITHCLWGVQGATIDDVTEIYSHEQAINQCSEFIQGLKNVKIYSGVNTAVSAENVAKLNDKKVMAIASREAGEMYGLKLIKSAIQNNMYNYTRFICIAKDLHILKNATKLSLMINLPHKRGSLAKVLSLLNTNNVNITKLESRPIAGTDFEFMFYFDFDADISDIKVINMLEQLEQSSDNLTFLGAYLEV